MYTESAHLPLYAAVFLPAVFIQSSAEELYCRGVLYQKFMGVSGKPVVAIIGNALRSASNLFVAWMGYAMTLAKYRDKAERHQIAEARKNAEE